jgi:hypothetical protein
MRLIVYCFFFNDAEDSLEVIAAGASSGNTMPAAVAAPAVEPDPRKRTADPERRAKRAGASRGVPATKGKPKKGNNVVECGIII